MHAPSTILSSSPPPLGRSATLRRGWVSIRRAAEFIARGRLYPPSRGRLQSPALPGVRAMLQTSTGIQAPAVSRKLPARPGLAIACGSGIRATIRIHNRRPHQPRGPPTRSSRTRITESPRTHDPHLPRRSRFESVSNHRMEGMCAHAVLASRRGATGSVSEEDNQTQS